MKKEKPNPKVTFAGRFDITGITGGPAKTANRLFTEHTKNNNASFITYYFDGASHSLHEKLFGSVMQNANGKELYTLGLFRIYGTLRKLKPDIIHIVTFERFTIFILLYKLFNKVKILYNSHGIVAYEDEVLKELPQFYKFRNRFCEKRLLKNSDKVIFPSVQAIDIAEKCYSLSISNAIILPGGIDRLFHNPVKTVISNETLKAVFVFNSELNQSGLGFLVKYILDEIASPRLELYVISDAEIKIPETERIMIHYNSKINAEKLAEFYKDKDVFLSLNAYDTFSISTAEAMASGLIPVITSNTGISRYVDNGYNGYVIEHGDTQCLRERLNRLSEMRPEKRSEISGNAALIYESLSWEKVYAMYNDVYMRMVK